MAETRLYGHRPDLTNGSPTIVGDDPLRDGSDDTYVEVTTITSVPRQDTDREDFTHGNMDTLAAPPAAGAVISVNYRATVTTNGWDATDDYMFILHSTLTPLAIGLHPFPDPDRPIADGLPHTYSFPITDALLTEWDYTREMLIDILMGGAFYDIVVSRGSTMDLPDGQWTTTMRVHEFWLSIGPGSRRSAYNRIAQRGSDGYGITGGRRVLNWRSGQASNRRGPAAIW